MSYLYLCICTDYTDKTRYVEFVLVYLHILHRQDKICRSYISLSAQITQIGLDMSQLFQFICTDYTDRTRYVVVILIYLHRLHRQDKICRSYINLSAQITQIGLDISELY